MESDSMTTDEDMNAAPGVDDIASSDAELNVDALREELDAARAAQARAMADYANLQRRSREERAEVSRVALSSVVSGFLPVLDDLDRAVEAAESADHGASWIDGLRLVGQKFRQVLEQHGVTELDAQDQAFDPMRHESIGAVPGPDGQVVQVLRRGYALQDRVIRPAMVMVGNGEEPST